MRKKWVPTSARKNCEIEKIRKGIKHYYLFGRSVSSMVSENISKEIKHALIIYCISKDYLDHHTI
jgi:hypothetical protein